MFHSKVAILCSKYLIIPVHKKQTKPFMNVSSLTIILNTFTIHPWRPAHPQVRNRCSNYIFKSQNMLGFLRASSDDTRKPWWIHLDLKFLVQKRSFNPWIQKCQPDFNLGLLVNQCWINAWPAGLSNKTRHTAGKGRSLKQCLSTDLFIQLCKCFVWSLIYNFVTSSTYTHTRQCTLVYWQAMICKCWHISVFSQHAAAKN